MNKNLNQFGRHLSTAMQAHAAIKVVAKAPCIRWVLTYGCVPD